MTATPAAILRLLAPGERSGRELRQLLAAQGIRLSAPAFYAMMAHMEDDGLVTGWYEEKVVEGVAIRERRYRC